MTLIRRVLEIVLVVYVVGAFALAAAADIAPLTGHGLLAVRSPSMSPALAVGDLVVAAPVAAADVRPGDVIVIRLASGTMVTHRVVAAVATDEGPVFTTKGDANASPDPVAAHAGQLQGRLAVSVALLGFILAMLTMPSGIAALFSIGATLLIALWLLDEVGEDDALEELIRTLEAHTGVGSTTSPPHSPATP